MVTSGYRAMKVRYDRNACDGMIVCLQAWDGFDQPNGEFKPVLQDADEIEEGVYEREIPKEAEDDATQSARVCPADAITIIEE